VLYHYHNELSPLGPNGEATLFRNLIDRGFLGVTFFFVLSGYILSLNYLGRFGEKVVDIKSFFVARFARIYPLYILSVVACSPYVLFNPAAVPHGEDIANLRSHPWSAIAMYVLGAESHWSKQVGRLTVLPSWSISTEFFFYLLFPGCAWIVSRLSSRQAKIALTAVFGWTALWLCIYHFMLLSKVLFFLDPATVQAIDDFVFQRPTSGIHTNLPLFLSGMLTYRAFEKEEQNRLKRWLSPVLLSIIVVTFSWFILQPRESFTKLEFFTRYLEFLPFCTTCMLWLHKGGGRVHEWLGNKTLVILGEMSFALYLVHSPVRLAGRFLIAKPLGIPEASPLFYIPLWAISLGLSWLAWKLIEVPARKAILGKWHQLREKSNARATV
jgi:peptidoglycan/LPS O-acetylase OafA/YrhL